MLSEKNLNIINAKICPYCNSETRVTTETEIYGKEYKGRKVFVCNSFPSCNSYVGTHDDGTPLGRLANKELRNAKIKAHYWFDKIWKEKHIDRGDLYGMLSEYLSIPKEYTHIGMFSEKTCLKVEEWSKDLYNKIKI